METLHVPDFRQQHQSSSETDARNAVKSLQQLFKSKRADAEAFLTECFKMLLTLHQKFVNEKTERDVSMIEGFGSLLSQIAAAPAFKRHAVKCKMRFYPVHAPGSVSDDLGFTADKVSQPQILFAGDVNWNERVIGKFTGQFAAVDSIVFSVSFLPAGRDISRIDDNIVYANLLEFPMKVETAKAASYPKTRMRVKFLFLRREETILAGNFIGLDHLQTVDLAPIGPSSSPNSGIQAQKGLRRKAE